MLIETIGYQGGQMFIESRKVIAFQHYKNSGDNTPSGITPHPQTKIWIQGGHESEEWIVLEKVVDFKRKYEEATK